MSQQSVAKTKGSCVAAQHFCRDRVGQGQEFYVTIEYFYVATEFGLGQGSYVAT